MKGIFKLYIFKLIILSLTMIFISFGASAKSDVEMYYKYCKPYQNNGFSADGLNETKLTNSLKCVEFFAILKMIGERNCYIFNSLRKNNRINDKSFIEVARFTANSTPSVDAIISSFIKYAENNPASWVLRVDTPAPEYLSKEFPCKLGN